MNEMVNQFLLAGDKFMPEMHLKHPGFIHSACEPFTKNKKRRYKLYLQKMTLVGLVFNMTCFYGLQIFG